MISEEPADLQATIEQTDSGEQQYVLRALCDHLSGIREELSGIRTLLEAGADPNRADNDGETALYGATWGGHAEAIRVLLQAGANPNRANNNGNTPLAAARASNNEAVALALVEAGARE